MEVTGPWAKEIFDKGILRSFFRRELLEVKRVEFGRDDGGFGRSMGFWLGSHFDKILIWTVIE